MHHAIPYMHVRSTSTLTLCPSNVSLDTYSHPKLLLFQCSHTPHARSQILQQAEVALRRALGLCLTLAHGCVDVGGDACARGVVRELSELARRQGRPSDPLALLEAATAAHHAQAAAAAAAGVAVGAEGESGIV